MFVKKKKKQKQLETANGRESGISSVVTTSTSGRELLSRVLVGISPQERKSSVRNRQKIAQLIELAVPVTGELSEQSDEGSLQVSEDEEYVGRMGRDTWAGGSVIEEDSARSLIVKRVETALAPSSEAPAKTDDIHTDRQQDLLRRKGDNTGVISNGSIVKEGWGRIRGIVRQENTITNALIVPQRSNIESAMKVENFKKATRDCDSGKMGRPGKSKKIVSTCAEERDGLANPGQEHENAVGTKPVMFGRVTRGMTERGVDIDLVRPGRTDLGREETGAGKATDITQREIVRRALKSQHGIAQRGKEKRSPQRSQIGKVLKTKCNREASTEKGKRKKAAKALDLSPLESQREERDGKALKVVGRITRGMKQRGQDCEENLPVKMSQEKARKVVQVEKNNTRMVFGQRASSNLISTSPDGRTEPVPTGSLSINWIAKVRQQQSGERRVGQHCITLSEESKLRLDDGLEENLERSEDKVTSARTVGIDGGRNKSELRQKKVVKGSFGRRDGATVGKNPNQGVKDSSVILSVAMLQEQSDQDTGKDISKVPIKGSKSWETLNRKKAAGRDDGLDLLLDDIRAEFGVQKEKSPSRKPVKKAGVERREPDVGDSNKVREHDLDPTDMEKERLCELGTKDVKSRLEEGQIVEVSLSMKAWKKEETQRIREQGIQPLRRAWLKGDRKHLKEAGVEVIASPLSYALRGRQGLTHKGLEDFRSKETEELDETGDKKESVEVNLSGKSCTHRGKLKRREPIDNEIKEGRDGKASKMARKQRPVEGSALVLEACDVEGTVVEEGAISRDMEGAEIVNLDIEAVKEVKQGKARVSRRESKKEELEYQSFQALLRNFLVAGMTSRSDTLRSARKKASQEAGNMPGRFLGVIEAVQSVPVGGVSSSKEVSSSNAIEMQMLSTSGAVKKLKKAIRGNDVASGASVLDVPKSEVLPKITDESSTIVVTVLGRLLDGEDITKDVGRKEEFEEGPGLPDETERLKGEGEPLNSECQVAMGLETVCEKMKSASEGLEGIAIEKGMNAGATLEEPGEELAVEQQLMLGEGEHLMEGRPSCHEEIGVSSKEGTHSRVTVVQDHTALLEDQRVSLGEQKEIIADQHKTAITRVFPLSSVEQDVAKNNFCKLFEDTGIHAARKEHDQVLMEWGHGVSIPLKVIEREGLAVKEGELIKEDLDETVKEEFGQEVAPTVCELEALSFRRTTEDFYRAECPMQHKSVLGKQDEEKEGLLLTVLGGSPHRNEPILNKEEEIEEEIAEGVGVGKELELEDDEILEELSAVSQVQEFISEDISEHYKATPMGEDHPHANKGRPKEPEMLYMKAEILRREMKTMMDVGAPVTHKVNSLLEGVFKEQETVFEGKVNVIEEVDVSQEDEHQFTVAVTAEGSSVNLSDVAEDKGRGVGRQGDHIRGGDTGNNEQREKGTEQREELVMEPSEEILKPGHGDLKNPFYFLQADDTASKDWMESEKMEPLSVNEQLVSCREDDGIPTELALCDEGGTDSDLKSLIADPGDATGYICLAENRVEVVWSGSCKEAKAYARGNIKKPIDVLEAERTAVKEKEDVAMDAPQDSCMEDDATPTQLNICRKPGSDSEMKVCLAEDNSVGFTDFSKEKPDFAEGQEHIIKDQAVVFDRNDICMVAKGGSVETKICYEEEGVVKGDSIETVDSLEAEVTVANHELKKEDVAMVKRQDGCREDDVTPPELHFRIEGGASAESKGCNDAGGNMYMSKEEAFTSDVENVNIREQEVGSDMESVCLVGIPERSEICKEGEGAVKKDGKDAVDILKSEGTVARDQMDSGKVDNVPVDKELHGSRVDDATPCELNVCRGGGARSLSEGCVTEYGGFTNLSRQEDIVKEQEVGSANNGIFLVEEGGISCKEGAVKKHTKETVTMEAEDVVVKDEIECTLKRVKDEIEKEKMEDVDMGEGLHSCTDAPISEPKHWVAENESGLVTAFCTEKPVVAKIQADVIDKHVVGSYKSGICMVEEGGSAEWGETGMEVEEAAESDAVSKEESGAIIDLQDRLQDEEESLMEKPKMIVEGEVVAREQEDGFGKLAEFFLQEEECALKELECIAKEEEAGATEQGLTEEEGNPVLVHSDIEKAEGAVTKEQQISSAGYNLLIRGGIFQQEKLKVRGEPELVEKILEGMINSLPSTASESLEGICILERVRERLIGLEGDDSEQQVDDDGIIVEPSTMEAAENCPSEHGFGETEKAEAQCSVIKEVTVPQEDADVIVAKEAFPSLQEPVAELLKSEDVESAFLVAEVVLLPIQTSVITELLQSEKETLQPSLTCGSPVASVDQISLLREKCWLSSPENQRDLHIDSSISPSKTNKLKQAMADQQPDTVGNLDLLSQCQKGEVLDTQCASEETVMVMKDTASGIEEVIGLSDTADAVRLPTNKEETQPEPLIGVVINEKRDSDHSLVLDKETKPLVQALSTDLAPVFKEGMQLVLQDSQTAVSESFESMKVTSTVNRERPVPKGLQGEVQSPLEKTEILAEGLSFEEGIFLEGNAFVGQQPFESSSVQPFSLPVESRVDQQQSNSVLQPEERDASNAKTQDDARPSSTYKKKGRPSLKELGMPQVVGREEETGHRLDGKKRRRMLLPMPVDSGTRRIRPRPLDPEQPIPVFVEGRDKEYDGGAFYHWLRQQGEGGGLTGAGLDSVAGNDDTVVGGGTACTQKFVNKKSIIAIPSFRIVADYEERQQQLVKGKQLASCAHGTVKNQSSMALPSAYDMDDEDEEWLRAWNQHVNQASSQQLLPDNKFEEIMEYLERASARLMEEKQSSTSQLSSSIQRSSLPLVSNLSGSAQLTNEPSVTTSLLPLASTPYVPVPLNMKPFGSAPLRSGHPRHKKKAGAFQSSEKRVVVESIANLHGNLAWEFLPGANAAMPSELPTKNRNVGLERIAQKLLVSTELERQIEGQLERSLEHPVVLDAGPQRLSEECSICNGGEDSHNNPVYKCKLCLIHVHQSCYGIREKFRDDHGRVIAPPNWCCRKCEAVAAGKTEADISCVLCRKRRGALKPTVNPEKWAHVACALYTNETFFVDADAMEPIDGIAAVEARVQKQQDRCGLCGVKTGSCARCAVKGCRAPFHISCGVSQGATFQLRQSKQQVVGVRSLCPRHAGTPPVSNFPLESVVGRRESFTVTSGTTSSAAASATAMGNISTASCMDSKEVGIQDGIVEVPVWQESEKMTRKLARPLGEGRGRPVGRGRAKGSSLFEDVSEGGKGGPSWNVGGERTKGNLGILKRKWGEAFAREARERLIGNGEVRSVGTYGMAIGTGGVSVLEAQGKNKAKDRGGQEVGEPGYLSTVKRLRIKHGGQALHSAGTNPCVPVPQAKGGSLSSLVKIPKEYTSRAGQFGAEDSPVDQEEGIPSERHAERGLDQASNAAEHLLILQEAMQSELAAPHVMREAFVYWCAKRAKLNGALLHDLQHEQLSKARGIFNKDANEEKFPVVPESPHHHPPYQRLPSVGSETMWGKTIELRRQLELMRSLTQAVVQREKLKYEGQLVLHDIAMLELNIAQGKATEKHCFWCLSSKNLLNCRTCLRSFCFQCFKHRKGFGVKGWVAAVKQPLYSCSVCQEGGIGTINQQKLELPVSVGGVEGVSNIAESSSGAHNVAQNPPETGNTLSTGRLEPTEFGLSVDYISVNKPTAWSGGTGKCKGKGKGWRGHESILMGLSCPFKESVGEKKKLLTKQLEASNIGQNKFVIRGGLLERESGCAGTSRLEAAVASVRKAGECATTATELEPVQEPGGVKELVKGGAGHWLGVGTQSASTPEFLVYSKKKKGVEGGGNGNMSNPEGGKVEKNHFPVSPSRLMNSRSYKEGSPQQTRSERIVKLSELRDTAAIGQSTTFSGSLEAPCAARAAPLTIVDKVRLPQLTAKGKGVPNSLSAKKGRPPGKAKASSSALVPFNDGRL